MKKPKILVTAATGNTGAATVTQLLERGYPVRALVRREDQRSERLRQRGAEIVVGAMDDILAMRAALTGVQRAYYCAPFARDSLAMAATFAATAQEQRRAPTGGLAEPRSRGRDRGAPLAAPGAGGALATHV